VRTSPAVRAAPLGRPTPAPAVTTTGGPLRSERTYEVPDLSVKVPLFEVAPSPRLLVGERELSEGECRSLLTSSLADLAKSVFVREERWADVKQYKIYSTAVAAYHALQCVGAACEVRDNKQSAAWGVKMRLFLMVALDSLDWYGLAWQRGALHSAGIEQPWAVAADYRLEVQAVTTNRVLLTIRTADHRDPIFTDYFNDTDSAQKAAFQQVRTLLVGRIVGL